MSKWKTGAKEGGQDTKVGRGEEKKFVGILGRRKRKASRERIRIKKWPKIGTKPCILIQNVDGCPWPG